MLTLTQKELTKNRQQANASNIQSSNEHKI